MNHVGSLRLLTYLVGSSNMRSYGYQPFGSEILSGFGARTPATGYVANADDFGPKLYCGFPNQSFTQNYVYDSLERITQATETFGTIGSSTPGWSQIYSYDS